MRLRELLGLAAALAALALLSTGAAAAGAAPLTTWNATGMSFYKALPISDGFVAAASNGSTTLLVKVLVNASNPLPRVYVYRLAAYSARIAALAVDNASNPTAIAVGLSNGVIDILAANGSLIYEFATPSAPSALAFVGRTLLVLERVGGENVLYAVAPTTLGWFEARLAVGNLVSVREERLIPLQLLRVDGAPWALLLAEAKPLNLTAGAAQLSGVLLAAGPNNTLTPLSNAVVVSVDPASGTILGNTTTGSTGAFTVPVPPRFTSIVLYVEVNNTCYSFTVSANMATRIGNSYTLNTPLVLRPGTPPVACPREVKGYRLLLLKPGTEPLQPATELLQVNLSSTQLRLVDAYLNEGRLYIWVEGQGLVTGANTRLPTLLSMVVDSKTLTPLKQLWRYYYTPEPVTTVTHSPDAGLALAATSRGLVLAAARVNGAYTLLWSTQAGGPVTALLAQRLGNTSYYLAAAATSRGTLSAAYISPATGKARLLTSSNGLPYIQLGAPVTALAATPPALAAATTRGVAAINNVLTPSAPGETISSLKPYTLTKQAIRVLDERGNIVNSFTVTYALTYNGTVLYKGKALGENGEAEIMTIYVANISLNITPLDTIHVPTRIETRCSKLVENPVLKLAIRNFTLTLRLLDSYTGNPPETPLEITIESRHLAKPIRLSYRPGAAAAYTLSLKADTYNITVQDLTHSLYYTYTATVSLYSDKTVTIRLARIPVLLTVAITSSYTAKPNDILVITLEAPNGKKLAEARLPAPAAGMTKRIDLVTRYRGKAYIVVKPQPTGGAKAAFYAPEKIEVNLTKTRIEAEVRLKPMKYRLEVATRASDTGAPVPSIIAVYSSGKAVAKEKTRGEAVFELLRGSYTVKAEPLPPRGYRLPLYSGAESNVTLEGNASVTLELRRTRKLTNVTIRDPYSPNGALIDDVTVKVDGVEAAELKKGSIGKVTLPLLLNGSKVELESKHKLYPRMEKKLKPSAKPITIAYPRATSKLTIYVLNDVGQPVAGAHVTITGVDVRYSTSGITLPDGTLDVNLPIGKYQVCVSVPGYNPACTSATVGVKPVRVSMTVTPKPLTIVMRYSNLIAITVFAIVVVVIIRRYFKKVLERFTQEEEF